MKKDTSKYNLEVGRRLFEQRKKLKLSRSYLGELVGLHETTVKRYEDGDIKSLGIDKINVFSDALNCSAAYLMGWDVDSEEINFNNTDEIYRLAAHGIGLSRIHTLSVKSYFYQHFHFTYT